MQTFGGTVLRQAQVETCHKDFYFSVAYSAEYVFCESGSLMTRCISTKLMLH